MIRLNITRFGKKSNINYKKVSHGNLKFAHNFAQEVIKTIPKQAAQSIDITIKDQPIQRFLRKFVDMSIDDMKLKVNFVLKKGSYGSKPKTIDVFLTGEEFQMISKGGKTAQKSRFYANIISALKNLKK